MRHYTAGIVVFVCLMCSAVTDADQSVVAKHRQKFSTPLGCDNTVQLLRGVAAELNAAGVPGGPFGILRKGGGHNCHGFSTDIICAGQGAQQQQWDILGDSDGAAVPQWNGPLSPIRVDVCEIVAGSTPVPVPVPVPPSGDPLLDELRALRAVLAQLAAHLGLR